MRRENYINQRFGSVQEDHFGDWPHGFFMPAPIERELELLPSTQLVVAKAQLELGRLAGVAMQIQNPDVLLAPTLISESLSSSRIEGTQASLSDVLSADLQHEDITNENLREVFNYLQALKTGVERIEEWPITSRLFCELHTILLTGVRGQERSPGEIRRSPVWVGAQGIGPETATYIPPLSEHIFELLRDWELYVNEEPTQSAVIRTALMHYQFETIHPFLDGNARIGRVLIALLLIQDRVLATPILNLSAYIERNKTDYYQRLQGVREEAKIDEWIAFFAEGVSQSAIEGCTKIQRLLELQSKYKQQLIGDRSALRDLIDLMFSKPVLSVKLVQESLQISQPAASKILKKAESLGWLLAKTRTGRGGKQSWLAHEIWAATSQEEF